MKKTLYIAASLLLTFPLLAVTPEELSNLKQRAAKMDTEALHELISLSAAEDNGISGKELVRYCTLAAGQDDAEAQVFLYKCYAAGKYVTADREMAQMWKDSILATGNADALFKLGKAMMETDLPSERAEGKRHCELAATKGSEEAKKWKEERESAEKAEEERLAAIAQAAAEEREKQARAAAEERAREAARAARANGPLSDSNINSFVREYLSSRANGSVYGMSESFASSVRYKYSNYKTVSRQTVVDDIVSGWNRWIRRSYTLISIGVNDDTNTVEVVFSFSLSDTTGKSAFGYSKETWVLNSSGKIQSWDETISKKGAPSLSSGCRTLY